jgi:predicted protein tyrosine phosphatase
LSLRPGFLRAVAASAGLSILFLVVYGGCNWITSQRHDVGTFYFQWERALPFVPALILPYLSIDLFFVVAPFLCRTERELQIFSRRIIAAILIAGICFLLFPLRFAFPRPQTGGWTGALFDWFRGIDAPYNLVPSLHVALWMFLVDLYARRTRGLWFGAIMLWFVLIGLSPVLTYQHHVIDVIGGFLLATYCFYFFSESSSRLSVVPNYRIGSYYAVGALILFSCAVITWPWGALFLWPTIGVAIEAAAYFGIGPGIFRKANGKLPWSTRFVLGPCLLGQYLSMLYYRRQCRSWDEITSRIWIGRKLTNQEAAGAARAGVTAVLDLSVEFSEAKPFRAICYRNIPILDLTAPTQEQLREMAGFIAEHAESGIVYVHCKIGYSRSAAAVAAYLLTSGGARNVEEALATIRRARPSIVVRPEVIRALMCFAVELRDSPAVVESFSSREIAALRNNRA